MDQPLSISKGPRQPSKADRQTPAANTDVVDLTESPVSPAADDGIHIVDAALVGTADTTPPRSQLRPKQSALLQPSGPQPCDGDSPTASVARHTDCGIVGPERCMAQQAKRSAVDGVEPGGTAATVLRESVGGVAHESADAVYETAERELQRRREHLERLKQGRRQGLLYQVQKKRPFRRFLKGDY